jgi:hypothetical protein
MNKYIYMTVCITFSLPIIPYIRCIYIFMVLGNSRKASYDPCNQIASLHNDLIPVPEPWSHYMKGSSTALPVVCCYNVEGKSDTVYTDCCNTMTTHGS